MRSCRTSAWSTTTSTGASARLTPRPRHEDGEELPEPETLWTCARAISNPWPFLWQETSFTGHTSYGRCFFARADRRRLIGSQKARRRGSPHARHTNSRDVLEIVFSEAAALAARPRR